MEKSSILSAYVRVVHGLLQSYGQNVTAYTSSLGAALKAHGAQVEYVSGLFFPEAGTCRVDITVFTYDLLGLRDSVHWPPIAESINAWSSCSGISIALPQDDFSRPNMTEDLLLSGAVDYLFSPHAFAGRERILYPRLDPSRVFFVRNGYLNRSVLDYFHRNMNLDQSTGTRKVFARARRLPRNFGDVGSHKSLAIESLGRELSAKRIPFDFSVEGEDRLEGFAWFERLASSRAVVNPVGGSDIVDRQGWAGWDALNQAQKDSKRQKRTGLLGRVCTTRFPLPNFGPRVLETMALGTPQVLTNLPEVLDENFPGLAPWEHFIPLDFGLENVPEVADALLDQRNLKRISQAAKDYVYDDPTFFYESLAERVLGVTAGSNLGTPKIERHAHQRLTVLRETLSQDETMALHQALSSASRQLVGRSKRGRREVIKRVAGNAKGSFSSNYALCLEEILRASVEGSVTPFGLRNLPLLMPNNLLEYDDPFRLMGGLS